MSKKGIKKDEKLMKLAIVSNLIALISATISLIKTLIE